MDLVCQRSWPTLCNELAEPPLFQDLDLFVIGPFLSQHDVPYQWDELWLNLEERTMSQLWVRLFENSVIKSGRWISVGLLFETRNIISDLVFNCTDPLWIDAKRWVNQNKQKKRASIHLSFDHLHVWSVQDNAEELSVTLRITGWGSSVTGDVQTTWRAVQQLIITIMNSRILIDTSLPSSLLLLKRSVGWTTSSGKQMCHQNLNAIENPPALPRNYVQSS